MSIEKKSDVRVRKSIQYLRAVQASNIHFNVTSMFVFRAVLFLDKYQCIRVCYTKVVPLRLPIRVVAVDIRMGRVQANELPTKGTQTLYECSVQFYIFLYMELCLSPDDRSPGSNAMRPKYLVNNQSRTTRSFPTNTHETYNMHFSMQKYICMCIS